MSYLGNPQIQKKLRSTEKDALRQLNDDISWLLAQPQGRRVLWWMLSDLTGVYSSIVGSDPMVFHMEGRRAVGVDLMEMLMHISPTHYAQMITERMEQIRTTQTAKKAIIQEKE